jgi:hypothetical protein
VRGNRALRAASLVTADIEAGVHSTYTTNVNVNPPQLTI